STGLVEIVVTAIQKRVAGAKWDRLFIITQVEQLTGSMEIKDYLTMIRRWAWLLGLGLLLGIVTGVLISVLQTPIYEASTRVMVMRAPQQKSSDYTYLSDQQLVQTYIQLITTRPVIEAASAKLGFAVDRSQITVRQSGETQMIQLTVRNESAQRASDIANILIQVLIDQNETLQAGRYASIEGNIQAQIDQIEKQITEMRTNINTISAEKVQEQQKQVEAQIAALSSEVTQLQVEIQQLSTPTAIGQRTLLAEKQERLNQVQPLLTLYQQVYMDLVVLGKPVSAEDDTTLLAQMQSTLQLYQQIYINLLNNLEEIRLARLQNTPNIVQIEAATVPGSPVQPRPMSTIGLSAVVGLLLAGTIAYLIEYIDDRIRTPEDIARVLKLPVIGYIGDMGTDQNVKDGIHVVHSPRSPVAEAFRSLRTNLEFSNVDSSLTRILVTSPGPGEGKTTISTNLAAVIAQGGKRVLLIDADLRRPRIHSIFKVSNRVGLTTLFRGPTPVRSVMHQVEGIEGLNIITSGKLPPNPTELLASARMDQILEESSSEVDVIILDSPPSLVADFQVLAAKADGVFLVIQPGHTHADAALSTLDLLNRVNAKILGIVLNKISNGSHDHYYYPYKYDRNYYQQDEDPRVPVKRHRSNVVPSARSQEVHHDQEVYPGSIKTIQRFYSSQRQQSHLYMPPEEVPHPHDVPPQPKAYQGAIRIVSPNGSKKRTHSRADFNNRYMDQDDSHEEDNQ
ncbi:MAG TPA: polysaccharide biosynthesis tyrosine autokinase, partial [Anaerolineales bacterium]|nr:polysaccharide biosynthesis tyrosine autokinase [Anaerolineales bacterium]